MNDDLRDRLGELEDAVDADGDGGLLIAFQRKPDGELLDGLGDPLSEDAEPDVLVRSLEVMGRSRAEEEERTTLGPADTPSSEETVYVDPDDRRGFDE